MAVTPSIRIEQVDASAGTAGASRTDLALSKVVTLHDDANASGSYSWELVTPPTSAATLANANTATPTFTPDVTGTYLAYCTVDGIRSYSVTATGGRDSTQGGAAVLTSGQRLPAPGETRQFDDDTGWAAAIIAILRAALAGGGGGVSDHGELDGLADDDHTQYLRADGTRALAGNLAVDAGVTVDGRDVSVDGAKLDGIEANADVTDTANVDAAGAVMDSDFAGSGTGSLQRTGAGAYSVLVHNFVATAAPTVNDDSGDGYGVGSRWVDVSADNTYECTDASVGAAVWKRTDNAASSGDVTAASAFGTDNVLIRSDGTGKGVQSTGIVVDDSGVSVFPAEVRPATNGNYNLGTSSFAWRLSAFTGGVIRGTQGVTSDTSLNAATGFNFIYTGAGGHTMSLPGGTGGQVFRIVNAGTGNITLAATGGRTLDSVTISSTTITPGEHWTVQLNTDAVWYRVA